MIQRERSIRIKERIITTKSVIQRESIIRGRSIIS